MKQTFLLTALLFSAVAAMPVMAAEDFHALSQLQAEPISMTEEKLAAIEGGETNPVSVDITNIGSPKIALNIGILTQINACGICLGGLSNVGGINQSIGQ